jgi:hypothetical protein
MTMVMDMKSIKEGKKTRHMIFTLFWKIPPSKQMLFVLQVTTPPKMVAAWPSKMLVSYHITTWCHYPEDCNVNLHHCKNLKSCKCFFGFQQGQARSLITSCYNAHLLQHHREHLQPSSIIPLVQFHPVQSVDTGVQSEDKKEFQTLRQLAFIIQLLHCHFNPTLCKNIK